MGDCNTTEQAKLDNEILDHLDSILTKMYQHHICRRIPDGEKIKVALRVLEISRNEAREEQKIYNEIPVGRMRNFEGPSNGEMSQVERKEAVDNMKKKKRVIPKVVVPTPIEEQEEQEEPLSLIDELEDHFDFIVNECDYCGGEDCNKFDGCCNMSFD